ncbi:ribonuclease HI [Gleimia coleocanis DSM 15436]|uniref:Ribonuclease HI n=1 Tax=Gleimia coleocanis DSM 15436 TaxID=525245 RepID=C0VYC6_9ACTO|nr:alpha/beta fold hydrolase [Gleimia coleocanis]EEH64429.1 ribonuclease HI [Gleimia coleocanis DSM 15436]
MTIIAAADGSALKNPGPTGWAWAIDESTWRAGGFKHGTNNIGELYAVLDLLKSTAHLDEPLHILADSRYVIDSMTKWIHGWKRKDWKKADGSPVLNVELIQEIDALMQGRKVTFEWVRGHSGHDMNEFVDEKARAAATAFRDGYSPDEGPGLSANLREDIQVPAADIPATSAPITNEGALHAEIPEWDLFSFTIESASIAEPVSTQKGTSLLYPDLADTTESHTAYRIHGMNVVDHHINVPLDHANPRGQQISLFVREVNDGELPDLTKPALVFMQGGPGGRGVRPGDYRGGWVGQALKKYRVFILDQRGTGLSTRLDEGTLSAFGSPVQAAAYLKHFRADSIVRDAEIVRERLNGGNKWSSLGQSYGGFINTTYLSLAPQALNAVYYTGGLPGLTSIDEIYTRTYLATAKRNEVYFNRFKQDEPVLRDLVQYLSTHEEFLPNGERLSVGRLRMLGMMLGGDSGFDQLHYLFEGAFSTINGQKRLNKQFLDNVYRQVSMGDSPLYALMHETIYAGVLESLKGIPTAWGAWRLLDKVGSEIPAGFASSPEPRDLSTPIYLTGEHIYPWLFEEDYALRPLKEIAEILAMDTDWTPLYDKSVLASNEVPGAAAVYFEDMFVPTELSLETGALANIRTWVTNEYQHDGLRMDGAKIFERLEFLATE